MKDSAVGMRADLRSRHVVPDFRGNFPITHPGHSNLGPNGAFEEEHAEMPWVGVASTAPDMFRFAEMLRRRGEFDAVRILAPATVELATRNWTGEKPNELYKSLYHQRGWPPAPAYMGWDSPCAEARTVIISTAISLPPPPSATMGPVVRCTGSIRSAT